MVKIELMRIEPDTLLSGGSMQTLFKRMSSKSLFPRNGSPSLPTPTSTSTLKPSMTTNSVVSSSFMTPRNPYRKFKFIGRRGLISGGGSPERSSRSKKSQGEEELVTRLSLPCVHGCCYCVYGRLLGPVRVYMSTFTPEKDERKIKGIKDGNGNSVLPVSRKQDIKGLVYDNDTFSLHPPSVTSRQSPRSHKSFRHKHVIGNTGITPGYHRVWSSQPRVPHRLS